MSTLVVSPGPLLSFDLTLNKRRAGKAEMNLDPTGSPRHEQTVAVALRLIIAQDSVQQLRDKKGNARTMVTTQVAENIRAPVSQDRLVRG